MYSADLKERAINLYNKIKSYRSVEKMLNIGKSTLQRWVTGTSKTKPVLCINNIVSEIKKHIDGDKFITLTKIQTKLLKTFDKMYSISFIHTIITKTLKYSYKKVNKKQYNGSLIDLQQKQKLFINTVKNIDISKIICIDETYIHSNYSTNYGWSKRGEPIRHYVKSHPIKYSIIMAISNKKIIDVVISNKNINTESYLSFMSNLNSKYEGYHFLMDNVAFHKSKCITNIFVNSSNKLLYIPPYSPEFNPIEEVFSQIKRLIRNHPYSTIIERFKRCIAEVRQKHIKNYYEHSFRSQKS